MVATEPILIRKPRQQGVALIYVLLIFLLITAVATEIVTNLWLHTEKNARYLERTQAKQYALGAEQYIARLLEQDFLQDRKIQRMVDHNLEPWRVTSTNYEVEQGSIELQVEDEQGRFNINWLLARRSGAKTMGDSPYLPMLENLLSSLSINPQLGANVQQWLHKDQNQPAAAEMVSVSELMLVTGVTREDVVRLLPYITVIPARTKMNINTAPVEIIRTLHPNLTDTDALVIKNGLGKNGLANAEELRRLAALSGKEALFNEGLRQGGLLGFNSHYFSARIKATYRDTTFYLTTLFHRNREGQVEVVSREIGPTPVYRSPEV